MSDLEIILHEDLAGYEKTAVPNLKLSPFLIKTINANGRHKRRPVTT